MEIPLQRGKPMNTCDYTTPSVELNQVLQAAQDLGAGKTLASPEVPLDPARKIFEATGRPWNSPAADQDLATWTSGYAALDEAMEAAGMIDSGGTGMDLGLWLFGNIEQVLEDMGFDLEDETEAQAAQRLFEDGKF